MHDSSEPSVCTSAMAATTPASPFSGVAAPLVLGTWYTTTGALTFTFCPAGMPAAPEEPPEARVTQRAAHGRAENSILAGGAQLSGKPATAGAARGTRGDEHAWRVKLF